MGVHPITEEAKLTFDSSTVLITLSERLIAVSSDKSMLGFIHDYLAARLKVLRQIPVCCSCPGFFVVTNILNTRRSSTLPKTYLIEFLPVANWKRPYL